MLARPTADTADVTVRIIDLAGRVVQSVFSRACRASSRRCGRDSIAPANP
jgi:hypothetical protein